MNKNTYSILLALGLIVSSVTESSAAPLDAVVALARMSHAFAAISGYQSAAKFTVYKINADYTSTPSSQFDVDATVEKPNKLSLVTTQNSNVGVLVLTDGDTLTVFNAPKLNYVTGTVGPSSSALLTAVQSDAQACLTDSQLSELELSLTVPSMFYASSPNINFRVPGVVVKDTATAELHDGVRVIQVVQSFAFPDKAKIDYAFFVNPISYLPIGFSQYAVTPSGAYLPMIREEFSKFVPLNHPLPLSGYSFDPPPGSVQLPH